MNTAVAPSGARSYRALRVLACFFLALTALGNMAAVVFHSFERLWHCAEGVVLPGGHDVAYYCAMKDREYILLHLEPPAGAPAWQEGDRVELAYHLTQPQNAVLSEEMPPCYSNWLYPVGLGALPIALALGLFLWAEELSARRKRSCVARIRPCSWGKGLALAFAWVLRLAAFLCALVGVMLLLTLVAAVLTLPDANAHVVIAAGGTVIWLSGGIFFEFMARLLIRWMGRRG